MIKTPSSYGPSLDEYKNYLRVEHNTDDAYISSLATASLRLIYSHTNSDVIQTTYTYANESGSIVYTYDSVSEVTGALQTGYKLEITAATASFKTNAGVTLMPEDVKIAQYMMVAHLYENRGIVSPINLTKIPFAVDVLLAPYQRIALS